MFMYTHVFKGFDTLYVLDSVLRPAECLQSSLRVDFGSSGHGRVWHRRSPSVVSVLLFISI